ncbi:MAG TPA: phosphatidate cytidylyltransferase [Rhodocyclaceae bacterium]|nr:phosphatidate cytidylyltransferase [Rhodocyclaceae bacterium]
MLRQRVVTAVVLLAGLLGALFLLPQLAWLALVALVCGAAAWEWAGLHALTGWRKRVFASLTGMLCLLLGLLAGLGSESAGTVGALFAIYLVSAMFWIVLVPSWLRRKWRIERASTAVVIGLVVLIAPALALAHLRQVDPWLLLGAMALVWIAAYFVGRTYGRHKLAPLISPGKTWEGAAGAVVGVLIAGAVVFALVRPAHIPLQWLLALVPLLVVLTAMSIAGDLFESLLKRQAGLKDSGSLLPGHGGILDRIDSLTSTLPLVGLIVLWLTL